MGKRNFTTGKPSGVGSSVIITPLDTLNNGDKYSGNQIKVVRNGDGIRLNTMGDQMRVKLTGKDTLGQYALVEQYNEPGVGIPLHVHENEDEVFKLIEGVVEFTLDGNPTVLKAGDMIYCPRGIPHSWRVVGTEKAKVDLGFFPAGMELMLQELDRLPKRAPHLEAVGEIFGRYGIRFIDEQTP